jgi:hypothetical protein
MRDVVL